MGWFRGGLAGIMHRMYELSASADPPKPRLPGQVMLRADEDGAIDALAAELLIHANNCTRTFGDFQLAVSVSPQAEPLLRRMMYDPQVRSFPWARTRLWLVDEVSTDPALSRGVALRELWGEHSGIPQNQVHVVRSLSEEGVDAYEAELREALGWREKGHDRLDAVLLTLESGGGVAGILPGEPESGERLVAMTRGEDERRVSMTIHLMNAARFVGVLACGEASRDAIGAVIRARRAGDERVPAARLNPLGGDLRWYIDRGACPGPIPL